MLSLCLEVFIKQEYHFLIEDLRPNTIVIDIGAAFGETAIYFAQFDNVKRVDAYEPSPLVYSQMQQYIAESPFNGKIRQINAAIKGNDSEMIVQKVNRDLQEAKSSKEGMRIPVYSLKTVLKGEKNLIIKCDCEGGKYEIFEHVNKGVLKECYKIQIELQRNQKP